MFTKLYIKTLLILLIFSNSSILASEITEVTLASEEWKKATNSDGTGFYWELCRLVFAESNIKLNHKIAPYIGSVELTKKGEVDGWLGSYMDEADFALYPKYNIDMDKVYSISLKGNIDKKSFLPLAGKNVAWIQGYSYDKYINYDITKTEINNLQSGIKMLKRKKVDVIIDVKQEIFDALKNSNENDSIFDIKEVMKLKKYLAFGNSKRARELSEIWDKNFSTLLKSGKINSLYKKYNYTDYRHKNR